VDRLPQNMGTVRSHEGRDLDAIHDGIEAGPDIRLGAYGIDACISSAAIGHFLDPVVDVLFLKIQCNGAGCLGQGETLRDGIDGDDTFCTQQESALDRELPDGTAPPDRNRLAAL